jgi:hypothetical protein
MCEDYRSLKYIFPKKLVEITCGFNENVHNVKMSRE